MSKFRCVNFIMNPDRKFEMVFQNRIPFLVDSREAYLRALRELSFQQFVDRNQLFFRTIGGESEEFMRNRGMAYRLIINSPKGGGKTWGNTSLFAPVLGEVFRGSIDDAGRFLKVFAMTNREKDELLTSAINRALNSNNRYDPVEAFRRSGVEVPASDRGLSPDYRKVIDDPYKDTKYPLFFDNDPDKFGNFPMVMMGDSKAEIAMANKLTGIGDNWSDLYVWHHLDDFDPFTNTCTMQLVLKEFHKLSNYYGGVYRHVGGSNIYRRFYFAEDFL